VNTPVPTPPEVFASDASRDAHGLHEVTELLHAWGAGDPQACEALARLVYDELRRQARRALRRERDGQTLQATALVHEAWLRLDRQSGMSWESRTQFFAVAAQMMRRILVDRARERHALKRSGASVRVTIGALDQRGSLPNADVAPSPLDPIDLLALDDALARLALFDPQKARLVELRYFAGLSIPEAAMALGISPATVGREWAVARMWLRRELST